VQTVIFDLDGTLVDSLNGIGLAMKKTLAEYGYSIEIENILPRIGAPMLQVVEELTNEKSEKVKIIYDRYLTLYRKEYLHKITPLNGANTLIDSLYKNNISLAIVTNKTERDAQSVVQSLNWVKQFKIIVGRDTKELPKPHPAGTIYALNKCNSDPQKSVFIGDTEYDMAAGKNAGIRSLIGLLGSRNADQLKNAGATQVASSLVEVEKILLHS